MVNVASINNKYLYEKNKDTALSLAICFLLSYRAIILFISTVTDYIFTPTSIDTWICYLAMLFVLIWAMLYCLNVKWMLFIGGILFFYMMSYWIFEDNQLYMFTSWGDLLDNPLYVFVVYSLSTYVFVRQLSDYSCFEKIFLRFSVVVVFGDLIAAIMLVRNDNFPEYMTYSYNMLPHVIFLILYSLKYKQKWSHFVLGIAGFVGILIFGARGALLCVLISILLYIIFEVKGIKKLLVLWLIIIFAIILMVSYHNIINDIYNIMIRLGINSRTVYKFLTNDFFTSSSRVAIYKSVQSNIGFMPKGIYADRVCLGGTYAHNIFLEILLEHGYIYGFIILFLILFIITNSFSKNNQYRYLSCIFLTAGFLKLFVTGSYLSQEPCFYLLLGLGVNEIVLKRKRASSPYRLKMGANAIENY